MQRVIKDKQPKGIKVLNEARDRRNLNFRLQLLLQIEISISLT
jgi:hypothetical protein